MGTNSRGAPAPSPIGTVSLDDHPARRIWWHVLHLRPARAVAVSILAALVSVGVAPAGPGRLSIARRAHQEAGGVLASGRALAWGMNGRGQLGTGTRSYSNVPLPVQGLTMVVAAAGGGRHSLALRRDGTVWAWGLADLGQLGQPTRSCGVPYETDTCSTLARRVPRLARVIAIAAAGDDSLALTRDGRVWVWGDNGQDQLGLGDEAPFNCPAASTSGNGCQIDPTLIPVLSHVVAIAACPDAAMALKADGTVWMWGSNGAPNSLGVVGYGPDSGEEVSTPTRVQRVSDAVAIATGGDHSLAATRDGRVWAWGSNFDQARGDGSDMYDPSNAPYPPPAPLPNLPPMVTVAAGASTSFAVARDGHVWAWGNNQGGSLGIGRLDGTYRPTRVDKVTHAVALAAENYHTLALTSNGAVWAWGDNTYGQLGIGVSGGIRAEPVLVPRLTHVVGIATGENHSLAVLATFSPHYIPPRH